MKTQRESYSIREPHRLPEADEVSHLNGIKSSWSLWPETFKSNKSSWSFWPETFEIHCAQMHESMHMITFMTMLENVYRSGEYVHIYWEHFVTADYEIIVGIHGKCYG